MIVGVAVGSARRSASIEPQASRSEQPHDSGMCLRMGTNPPPQTIADGCFQRDEKDLVQLQSGIEHGITLGTPIGLLVRNEDQRPRDYSETDLYPRPSHADWTYLEKYGVKASSGGGRSSARETIGRVAAGAIAEKYLKLAYGVEIVAFVSSVGKVHLPSYVSSPSQVPADDDDAVEDVLSPEFVHLLKTITREEVDKQTTRCPHAETADLMTKVCCRLTRKVISRAKVNHRPCSVSFAPKKPRTPSEERSLV